MPGLLDHASADGTLFDIGDYDYGEWRRLLAERTRQDPRDMDDGLVRDIVDDLRADAVGRLCADVELSLHDAGLTDSPSPAMASLRSAPTGVPVVSVDSLDPLRLAIGLRRARVGGDGELELTVAGGQLKVRGVAARTLELVGARVGETLRGDRAEMVWMAAAPLGDPGKALEAAYDALDREVSPPEPFAHDARDDRLC